MGAARRAERESAHAFRRRGTGEVAHEEDRVTRKDAVAKDKAGGAHGVPRQVPHNAAQVADVQLVALFVQLVEGALELSGRNIVHLGKVRLSRADARVRADGDAGRAVCRAVEGREAQLEVRRCGEVIGVGVRLENAVDYESLLLDKGGERIGRLCRHGVRRRVVVEDRVDDGAVLGRRVHDEVRPRARRVVIKGVDERG